MIELLGEIESQVRYLCLFSSLLTSLVYLQKLAFREMTTCGCRIVARLRRNNLCRNILLDFMTGGYTLMYYLQGRDDEALPLLGRYYNASPVKFETLVRKLSTSNRNGIDSGLTDTSQQLKLGLEYIVHPRCAP